MCEARRDGRLVGSRRRPPPRWRGRAARSTWSRRAEFQRTAPAKAVQVFAGSAPRGCEEGGNARRTHKENLLPDSASSSPERTDQTISAIESRGGASGPIDKYGWTLLPCSCNSRRGVRVHVVCRFLGSRSTRRFALSRPQGGSMSVCVKELVPTNLKFLLDTDTDRHGC